ncbi:MAG: orotidine-5'-phosphate decarboxylase [Nitrososphaera sp.]|nr:orotidine-5'-phosphate decarboxylase [Nitrososphaera sp.]
MEGYAERLISAIKTKGNPCVVGLDPRIDLMPDFATASAHSMDFRKGVRAAIKSFCEAVLDVVSPLVPAVKPQIAFYEQYGVGGLEALEDTIRAAKERGLLVIVDAKRSDIASTAEAYANAFLGRTSVFGTHCPIYDVDCITVSPFLGRDSLEPFVSVCVESGKGIFVLVKTSNRGSADIQDQVLSSTGRPLYEAVASFVDVLGRQLVGSSGYSAIGAVVGATFPEEARRLRDLMPRAIILVPGYGAQGGTAQDAIACFNKDGLGAIVNASRSITYAFPNRAVSREQFMQAVHANTTRMIGEITHALKQVRQ